MLYFKIHHDMPVQGLLQSRATSNTKQKSSKKIELFEELTKTELLPLTTMLMNDLEQSSVTDSPLREARQKTAQWAKAYAPSAEGQDDTASPRLPHAPFVGGSARDAAARASLQERLLFVEISGPGCCFEFYCRDSK